MTNFRVTTVSMLIIIIIYKALYSRNKSRSKALSRVEIYWVLLWGFPSSRQKPYQANEATTPGFKIGVYLLLDSCLARLMRLPPQDLKIGVYLLLDSCLTKLMRLPPQDLKNWSYHLLDSCLTRLMMLPPQDLKIGVYLLLDSYLTWLVGQAPQDLEIGVT